MADERDGGKGAPSPAALGPPDGRTSPRYSGLATFARLPRGEDVPRWDVGVLGIPFDGGTSYRPGARFGPSAVRSASRLLRPYNPELRASPFARQQVVDLGDVDCTPYDILAAIDQVEHAAREAAGTDRRLVSIGGDHTIALPLLRDVSQRWGPVALVHFDAHLDTFDTYMDAAYTHGTPFRRAAEEGCFRGDHSVHVGIRGSLYEPQDLEQDAALGFTVITSPDVERHGIDAAVAKIHDKVADLPVYISVDIDVADPAFAPGTGTPEAGGLSGRELLMILRGLAGLPVVGADVVEVAPAYDPAEATAMLASNVAFELITMMSINARMEPATVGTGVRPEPEVAAT